MLTLANSSTNLLCSLRKIVWSAAKAGCSLARISPATKHFPDSALHSLLVSVVGIIILPRP